MASKAQMPTKNQSTIDAGEAEHFGRLAADWWDPKGKSAMLHRLNPVRLAYVRDAIDLHFGIDEHSLKPLSGKRALDVGCGAGLLAEPLARMGADVTAIDAAAENIAAAKAHAAGVGLAIDYRACGIESLDAPPFDLVTSMEVIEHVSDPELFVKGLAGALAPGGLMILSTPNRTPMSRTVMIGLAENLGQVPRGTHDWHKFLTPEELETLLGRAGLKVVDVRGISFGPMRGLHLSERTALNYLVTVKRADEA